MDLHTNDTSDIEHEPAPGKAGQPASSAGHLSVLDEIYRRHKATIVRMLRRHVGTQEAAENLFHEAFRVTAERLSQNRIADQSKLAGFVYATARRIAQSDRRRFSQSRTDSGGDVIVSIAGDAREAPEASSERAQLAAVVRELLSEMSMERDRKVLVRLYLEERDRDEICAELGLSDEHFSRVLLRAKERFRSILAKHGLSIEYLAALLFAVAAALARPIA